MLARVLMNESPFAQMTREMDRLFSRPLPALGLGRSSDAIAPAVNIWQDDTAIHAEAELPGYRMEDIEILAHEDSLTIRGTRQITIPQGAVPLRAERAAGAFERTIALPVPVDVNAVTATLRDGVLTISMPMTPEVKPRRIAIQA